MRYIQSAIVLTVLVIMLSGCITFVVPVTDEVFANFEKQYEGLVEYNKQVLPSIQRKEVVELGKWLELNAKDMVDWAKKEMEKGGTYEEKD